MRGRVRPRQDKYGSPRGVTRVLTVFLRRITVHRGVAEDFPLDSRTWSRSDRLWISSSISGLLQSFFYYCESLASITFESNSKLPIIFGGSGLSTRPSRTMIVRWLFYVFLITTWSQFATFARSNSPQTVCLLLLSWAPRGQIWAAPYLPILPMGMPM
jgi:hypothetical protein